MSERFQLELIKREIDKSEEYGVPVKEARWFVETNDGFDGTAQGYGYTSPQALYRAYAYFKSKDQRKSHTDKVKQFLKDNPDVLASLKEYMDEDRWLRRAKEGEPCSVENMLEYITEDHPEVVSKLLGNKHLWNALIKRIAD